MKEIWTTWKKGRWTRKD